LDISDNLQISPGGGEIIKDLSLFSSAPHAKIAMTDINDGTIKTFSINNVRVNNFFPSLKVFNSDNFFFSYSITAQVS